jgi:hypothetical protein
MRTKDTEIVQQHGELLNQMAQRTREDGSLTLDLNIKAQHTARSMQALTVIALIYLPPSFLAVCNQLCWIPASPCLSHLDPTNHYAFAIGQTANLASYSTH